MSVNTAPAFPFQLVCPLCRGALEFSQAVIACRQCGEEFGYEDGFPDLIRGGRFDDDYLPDRMSYEEVSNSHLANEYLIPTFRRLLRDLPRKPRVLSLGCGVGIDVDLLADAGFEVVGIDCGNRCKAWKHRKQRQRFYLANGKQLPFDSNQFDVVYCGCVFPHVGVEGDSRKVLPNYYEERLAIAREMVRTLHPDGFITVSSPNRLFPLDIFHGRTEEHPYPYFNPPTNPFLLSAGDYRHMFSEAGCNAFRLLPVKGYWGFVNMKRTIKGRILSFPVDAIFRFVSKPAFRALRAGPISPWLVALARKSGLDQSCAW
ncbi:MAG: methyltransferase domain-containing protein [Bryobacteraceae bacterium]